VPAPVRQPGELSTDHPYLRLVQEARGSDEKKLVANESHLRELRACYYGMIGEVDDNLGLLFQALKDSDQWDDTLIIFTSDHGHCLGDHHVQGAEHFYDGAMRVPLIVRDPLEQAAATRGRQFGDLVETIDSAPTILDFLGVVQPDRFQGRSLLPMLRGDPTYAPRTQIHFEYDYRPMVLARNPRADPDRHLLWVVRDHEHKYVQFADENMPPILFDLQVDPGEFENIAGTPRGHEIVAQCCHKLLRWRMIHEDQRVVRWAQQLR
jgi:arylsulfatase A-like enzyme